MEEWHLASCYSVPSEKKGELAAGVREPSVILQPFMTHTARRAADALQLIGESNEAGCVSFDTYWGFPPGCRALDPNEAHASPLRHDPVVDQ
jgi:hypothetical protein